MNSNIIKQFQIEALNDILHGEDIKDIEYVMFDFEREEAYEECAGIKKALDSAKIKTMKELELEYLELINKNHDK